MNTEPAERPPVAYPLPFDRPVPGHWISREGAIIAYETSRIPRANLAKGELSDLEVANCLFLASRNDLDLIVWQHAAKDRIRWLSAQLAIAQIALADAADYIGDESAGSMQFWRTYREATRATGAVA